MKKKKLYMIITHPQQSLIINIGELYLRSEENHEESLGTPTKSVPGGLGGQQK